jgi:hypothetical protein
VLVAVPLLLATAAAAFATEQRKNSQPNGHFAVIVDVESQSDRDRDGNEDTATNRDRLSGRVDVLRRFGREQVAQFTVTVDRPGTEFDGQFTETAGTTGVFSGGGLSVNEKLNKKWGTGTYTITVDATSSRGDTATASGFVTID